MGLKEQPLGICDHCLGKIPRKRWYTSKGKPRRYCCRDCRNTANSRAGAQARSEKAKARVARGEWQNPASINPPSPTVLSQRISCLRQQEVAAGTWRNPALGAAAREKLSRPRKYSGDLHSAIEKLKRGKMSDLTEAEK